MPNLSVDIVCARACSWCLGAGSSRIAVPYTPKAHRTRTKRCTLGRDAHAATRGLCEYDRPYAHHSYTHEPPSAQSQLPEAPTLRSRTQTSELLLVGKALRSQLR